MSARREDGKLPKIDYSKITSGIIQRGEEMFPGRYGQAYLNYFKIQYFMEKIPRGGERLMNTGEVLELYD